MTTPRQVTGTGTAFARLGVVLAISFRQTPLKFRAPGITLPLGLIIGRLAFRALNTTEITLAAVPLAAQFSYRPGIAGWALPGNTEALLAIQTGLLRPRLDRRAGVLARQGLPHLRSADRHRRADLPSVR